MRLKILKFILFSRLVLCVMLQTLALLLQDCLTLNANIMACWAVAVYEFIDSEIYLPFFKSRKYAHLLLDS